MAWKSIRVPCCKDEVVRKGPCRLRKIILTDGEKGKGSTIEVYDGDVYVATLKVTPKGTNVIDFGQLEFGESLELRGLSKDLPEACVLYD